MFWMAICCNLVHFSPVLTTMAQTPMESVVYLTRRDSQCPHLHKTNRGENKRWREGDSVLCFQYLLSLSSGFDFGSVHFVLMSTEHRFDSGSAQLQYLDDHLSTVDRSKTPWLIFAGHRWVSLGTQSCDMWGTYVSLIIHNCA